MEQLKFALTARYPPRGRKPTPFNPNRLNLFLNLAEFLGYGQSTADHTLPACRDATVANLSAGLVREPFHGLRPRVLKSCAHLDFRPRNRPLQG